ncbi:PDZ domain-containing protein [Echinicola sp. CAU 1574]|uniref:PDZ domain-containing protein n=1 Tax=Echinicola arenosa TaxID=2774144 RepID=A0ABR9AGC5_9BACT|nr:S41 family peptidase [Echinicola arenosa]MBD8487539.1 PDZ domain-containing protein [Echinicola arenosa]
MKILKLNSWLLGSVFLLCFSLSSCGNSEMSDPSPTPDPDTDPDIEDNTSPNIAINNWIQEIMDDYYYWNSTMNTPLATDADPEDYFENLLVDQDHFSIIYPNYLDLINSLEGVSKEAGYEYILFRASQTNQNVIAIILYVKKGSPAEAAGLMRDDIVTEINGTTMTLSNYQSVLSGIDEDHTLTVARFDQSLNNGEGSYAFLNDPLSMSTVVFSENPVFMDSVYTIGSNKIGYLVYNFFSPGVEVNPNDNVTYGVYDQELDEIFADFKSKGVNELILDLRYNGGGYVTSAVNLASLIGSGISAGDVFYKTKYNSGLQAYFTQTYGADYLNNKFLDKAANIGGQLSSGTVHIIATGGTASASELIINGLSPYMTVKLIGETTYGKNVGSAVFEDDENEDNHYGLLPIISQSFNSLDQSEYSNGFDPDVESNEFDDGRLLPLGDINETMLSAAISQITGEAAGSRTIKKNRIDRIELENSVRNTERFGIMIGQKPLKIIK